MEVTAKEIMRYKRLERKVLKLLKRIEYLEGKEYYEGTKKQMIKHLNEEELEELVKKAKERK